MIQYANINGRLVDTEDATVQVNDLALLRGYGIFDYFQVKQGRALYLEDYLDRFERSATLLHLTLPVNRDELRRRIYQLIEANTLITGGIRLVLTGGFLHARFFTTFPNLYILAYETKPYPTQAYSTGIKVMLYEYRRELPEVKTVNYITAIWLLPKLQAAGAAEVLYHDRRLLSESARSNLFIITTDNKLVTPGQGVLKGITRKRVLEIAAEKGLEIEERDVYIDELLAAKEAFLTSSTKYVLPITQVDHHPIANGHPGAVTLMLKAGLEAVEQQYLKAEMVH